MRLSELKGNDAPRKFHGAKKHAGENPPGHARLREKFSNRSASVAH
jgi:hypothetical protein